MSFPGKLKEPGRQKLHDHNAHILKLPSLVLQHVFLYLEAPGAIRKIPHDQLHEVFKGNNVLESDPRDLYNLLRTCRTLYETYEDIVRGKQLFNRFYINISGPLHREPQLVQGIGTGKLQVFVVNPKWKFTPKSTVQKAFQDPGVVHSNASAHPQESTNHKDSLESMLSRQCLKWVGTFIRWPLDYWKQANNDPAVDLMANLRQNILGVINFHQYDSSNGLGNNASEDIRSVTEYNARRFWAIICHCKMDKFLVIHNAYGTVWDHSFTCPRIATVTSTYADARRTYEHALASRYFEVELGD